MPSRMRLGNRVGLAIVAWRLWSGPALAQEHDRHPVAASPPLTISLARAVELANQYGLETQRTLAESAATRELGQRANPALTQLPQLEAQLGPRFAAVGTRPDLVVKLTQPIVVGGVGKRQEHVARATQGVFEAALLRAKLNDGEAAAHAWIDLALADELLVLRTRATETADSLVQLERARSGSGENDASGLALAKGDAGLARSLVIEAEGWHFDAELALRTETRIPAHSRVEAAGGLPAVPLENAADAITRAHPDVLVAERTQALSSAEVGYRHSERLPTIAVGAQYMREGTGDQVLTGILVLPLPIAKPWAFDDARWRLQHEADRARLGWTRRRAASDLEAARHELAHARERHAQLEAEVLPPLREAERLALARYRAGAVDIGQVSIVRQRVLAAEEQLMHALADVHHARVRLLRHSGRLTEGVR